MNKSPEVSSYKQAHLRAANSDDANPITAIKRLAWPEEDCDPAQVGAVLAAPTHQTHVVEINGEMAGFVDGFLTRDAAGQTRWEVDLLAVHPKHSGRGLGSRLISANTQAGLQAGAVLVRALIHVENHASAGAFTRSGYKSQPGEYQLVILGKGAKPVSQISPLDKPYLVPVSTINYSGLWQESHFTPQGFAAACLALNACDHELVGAIIPSENYAALTTAAAAGFIPIGNYRWWAWFGV
jgi:GNAT superfamily N-acetyltransferase